MKNIQLAATAVVVMLSWGLVPPAVAQDAENTQTKNTQAKDAKDATSTYTLEGILAFRFTFKLN